MFGLRCQELREKFPERDWAPSVGCRAAGWDAVNNGMDFQKIAQYERALDLGLSLGYSSQRYFYT